MYMKEYVFHDEPIIVAEELYTSLLLGCVCNTPAWSKVTHWGWLGWPERPLQATRRGNYAGHRHYRPTMADYSHYRQLQHNSAVFAPQL